MRSLTILAALLTAVMFGTPVVRADPPRHQHRHQHRYHHHGYHSYGYSYPSVARYGGWNFGGWYPRPLYGFGHPYYYGISVAGPIHPLYGLQFPGYGYAPYSEFFPPPSLRIIILPRRSYLYGP